MKRMTFCLPEEQIKKLRKIQKEIGLTLSEIIRRSVDYWMENRKK